MGRSKLLLMLLLANLLTVLFLTNGAFGEELVRGGVVSPARVVATVAQGDQLPPIRVLNGGEEPLETSVYVGWGEHRWDGSPVYIVSPAERLW